MNYKNIKLIQVNNNDSINVEGFDDAKIYQLQSLNVCLGYALVKDDTNINNIYIYINPNERSNGYGSMLFKETLNVLKDLNIKSITLDIESSNYQMVNIINKHKSIEISNARGIKRFVIPIKGENYFGKKAEIEFFAKKFLE